MHFVPMASFSLPKNADPGLSQYVNRLRREAAVCAAVYADCLLLRIYEQDRYLFSYPAPLREGVGVADALLAIEEYALREGLPLLYMDVPPEALPLLAARYPRFTVEALDVDKDALLVSVHTPMEGLRRVPTLHGPRLTLGRFHPSDTAAYAALCRDEELLALWGYDYREDHPEGLADSAFVEMAHTDFLRGTALTLALRRGRTFLGEVTLYRFDGKGSAEVALRLLPDHRRMGYGSEALSILSDYAFGTLGLYCLRACVKGENLPSLSFFTSLWGSPASEADGVVHFVLVSPDL